MHFLTAIFMDLFFRLLGNYLEPLAMLALEHLMHWFNGMLMAAPPLMW